MEKLTVPQGHEHSVFVVNFSGGKDSTAVLLAMRESDIPHRVVFADTGWEVPQVYEHVALVERLLGIVIERVGVPGGMVAKIRQNARFPSRQQRWCTRELKIEPLIEFHERIQEQEQTDTVAVLGIRAEESERRARAKAFEFSADLGHFVWRPILGWTIADVLEIHHRHNVPVNPLYRLGFNRVGCMPCVYSAKEDIRLMAEHFPERVELLRTLEQEATEERARRNAEKPGRYSHPAATWFLRDAPTDPPCTIDEAVAWSQTSRGGRQLPLIREAPDSGCFNWGLCDAPGRA